MISCLGPALHLIFAMAGSPVMDYKTELVVGMIQNTGCYCVGPNIIVPAVTIEDGPTDKDCQKLAQDVRT